MQANKKQKKLKFELILIHNLIKKFPTHTARWLVNEHFFQHHHVRINNDNDYARLLRFLTGNAIGLVLGGGGARGWLHIGVLKYLIEAGIPIDAIGGTSVGSLAAGCYVNSQGEYQALYDKFSTLGRKSGPPFTPIDFTYPIISLFSGDRVTRAIDEAMGSHFIEDLWIPYFCISTNITAQQQHSHHTGKLAQKTRASSAIPGLLPPVALNGDIHYDGAICNNLPVDVMRNIVGAEGKIISVCIMPINTKKQNYNFPAILTFKDLALHKLNKKKFGYIFPPFFETFYKTITYGSATNEAQNKGHSDISIHPDLNQFSMLDSNKKAVNKLCEIGYDEIKKELMKWNYDRTVRKLVKK